MRARATLTFALGIAVSLAALALPVVDSEAGAQVAAQAGGRRPGASRGADAGAADPDGVRGVSEFTKACVAGERKYLARDFAGAVESFRRAIELAPKHPKGHYLLGSAQSALGNLVEAEASYRAAERLAGDKHVAMRGKALFVLAELKERQKRWEEAKAAWQAYAEWAAASASLGADAGAHPESASSRIQAVDETMRLEKQYAEVRARIAAEDGGAPGGERP
jgi:tetratricopeptide (TPR) repeat protein